MLSLLKKTTNLYLKNFWLYLKIISPLLIPLLALRLIAHYTYLGRLTIIFSTLFGVILGIASILIEIIIIKSSYRLLTADSGAIVKISLKQQWKQAARAFFPYLYLKILIGVIILSLPFALKLIGSYLVLPQDLYILTIIMVVWIISFVLLFLFSTYSFVIEKQRGSRALKRSASLFLSRPFYTLYRFLGGIAFFGGILIILASLTKIIIALLADKIFVLFNPYLSLWWQKLLIDIYALLAMPIVVIITTIIFYDLTKSGVDFMSASRKGTVCQKGADKISAPH
jgi:hypothetical protein